MNSSTFHHRWRRQKVLTAQTPTRIPAWFTEAPGKGRGFGSRLPGAPPQATPRATPWSHPSFLWGVCSDGVSRRVLSRYRRTARAEAEQRQGRMKPPDRALHKTPRTGADLVSGTGYSEGSLGAIAPRTPGSDPAARPRALASLITVYRRVAARPAGPTRPGGGWRRREGPREDGETPRGSGCAGGRGAEREHPAAAGARRPEVCVCGGLQREGGSAPRGKASLPAASSLRRRPQRQAAGAGAQRRPLGTPPTATGRGQSRGGAPRGEAPLPPPPLSTGGRGLPFSPAQRPAAAPAPRRRGPGGARARRHTYTHPPAPAAPRWNIPHRRPPPRPGPAPLPRARRALSSRLPDALPPELPAAGSRPGPRGGTDAPPRSLRERPFRQRASGRQREATRPERPRGCRGEAPGPRR